MKHCTSHTDTVMTSGSKPYAGSETDVHWVDAPCKRSHFMKNLAVASSLLICMVMLRSGAMPDATHAADAVLAASRQDDLLGDDLGKLTFVDALFPEAVLVFGESSAHDVAMPVHATALVHAWSSDEPYAAWTCSGTDVFAGISGEVSGVYHGMNEELIVQITGGGQTSCIAGNLTDVCVSAGDYVEKGNVIGSIREGSYCTFEVRQDGRSIDPAWLMEAP